MKHSALHALVMGCLWASFCHLLALTVSGLGLGQLIQMPAWPVLLLGGLLGLAALSPFPYKAISLVLVTGFAGLGLSKSPAYAVQLALYLGLGIYWIGCTTRWGINNRYRLELLWIRGLKLFGILALLVAVLFPLAVMVITSLKSQAQLLQNPLDLSVDWRNPDLFKSYITLIQEFGFATYFWNSLWVSAVTVVITLGISIPGAYAVARLRFPDDPKIFTLPRGVASLNSSELPRELLMAGAVMTTLPVMALFLWLERFMVQGLTAGSVKG